MKTILPDYTNCCVNVMNSIARFWGLHTSHPTLPLLDKYLTKDYKNVVVILLDGMGQQALNRHLPPTSFLRSHFVQELSAVYPSSTVPATVSFKTGLTPIEHGWWGHFLYFKNLGQTVNVFTNNDMNSRKKVAIDNVAQKIMPYTNLLDLTAEHNKRSTKSYMLCPTEARDDFHISQITYETFGEMCDYIKTLTHLDEDHLIYAYHDLPDNCMHKFGVYSPEVSKLMIDFDSQLEALCPACQNTLFVITADHGQTTLSEIRDVADMPELLDMLYMLPNGCSRATNFFVKGECKKAFESLIHNYFDDKFCLFSRTQVIQQNLLGVGEPHPEFFNTFGDYLLCATGNCEIVCSTLYGRPAPSPIGVHGGLTLEEMRVPLIVIDT